MGKEVTKAIIFVIIIGHFYLQETNYLLLYLVGKKKLWKND
jgi:hypothetical protein